MRVGDYLREARQAAGLTQEELAFKAQIHRTYVSLLERNKKSPTLDTFLRLTAALGVSAADIVRRLEDA
jgi:transcriptional regulator with XRE-family HTH domain